MFLESETTRQIRIGNHCLKPPTMSVTHKRSTITETDRLFTFLCRFDVKCFGFGGTRFPIDDGDSKLGLGPSRESVVFAGYFTKHLHKLIYIFTQSAIDFWNLRERALRAVARGYLSPLTYPEEAKSDRGIDLREGEES